MPQESSAGPTVLVFAGSARRASLNKQLARIAAEVVTGLGGEGVFVDLADYPLPLYDGDLEQAEGIPANAYDFSSLVGDADALLYVSPEYNGAYTPLLKNTIDWVTRIDRRVFAKPTALASASPGGTGGRNGLKLLRATLEHMAVPVIDEQFTLPHASDVLSHGELTDATDRERLESMISSLMRSIVPVPA